MFEYEYAHLEKSKLVPVVALTEKKNVVPLAKALLAGGIDMMEITFRNPNDYKGTADAISDVRTHVPKMTVGAGTVTSIEIAKLAVSAGAKFIVSPGFYEPVVDYAVSSNIVTYPGVSTASEITLAASKNLKVLKFFPSEAFGGIKTIKAYAGPFPLIKFLPSGGITFNNLKNYIELSNVAAVSGSWMVKVDLIENCQWEKITQLSREAIKCINNQ